VETQLTGGFTGIETLVGQAGDDAFNLVATGNISIAVEGGDGDDTLASVSQGGATPNNWLIGSASNTLNANLNFSEIENYVGSVGIDNFTITDTSIAASGVIRGVAEQGGDDSAFTDTLTVTNSSSWFITGDKQGYVENVLGSAATDGFFDIEVLIGNGANDTLTGRNQNNAWQITSSNDGTVANAADPADLISFTNMENLRGNDQVFAGRVV